MSEARGPEPLIVTAYLDEPGFEALDALRRRHFPQSLNKVPAHVSLFHQLPGAEFSTILTRLAERCRETRRFALGPGEWRSLGRGVAIAYPAPALARLRATLADDWAGWLNAQDRQGFRAHVTIQNKVDPAAAGALLDHLRLGQKPPTCEVRGLNLWRYLGGPWEHLATCRFGTDAS